jgi:APA family basic amino acid/polyamine antiporter
LSGTYQSFIEAGAPAAKNTGVAYSFMDYVKSFGVALIAVSFTYGGYQQTINFGEEVHDARRTIPRGIFIGIMAIILLYLAVSFAYYKAIGFENLKSARGIAAIVAEQLFGPTGRYVFSILLFIAVLAYVNVLLLSNPRVMYAMSQDGILPAAFKRRDEKRDVLTVSLTAFAIISVVVLFFAETFDKILGFTIFLDSIGMATSAATIFILRRRTRHLDGTGIYKMKLYPVLPLVFIAAYIFVGISIWIDTPELAWTALAVFAAFLLLYFLVTRFKKRALAMLKRYLPFGFWMTGLIVVVVRLVYHLQSGASAWRFVFDAMIIVLFTSNSIEAWHKLKRQN